MIVLRKYISNLTIYHNVIQKSLKDDNIILTPYCMKSTVSSVQ